MADSLEDIVIVGGGPAGAYLGYLLAKAGLHPVLFDHSHPREKPCGGGISYLALHKFPLIKKATDIKGIGRKIKIIAPSGSEFNIGSGYLLGVSRLKLDKYLIDNAVKAGVRHIPEKVINVYEEENHWVVETTRQKFKTNLLIGADGTNSIIRKKVIGPFNKKDITFTYGYFVTGAEKEVTTMKFLDGKKGYIWVFPRGDHTSIGICAEYNDSHGLKTILDDYIEETHPNISIMSKYSALVPTAGTREFFNQPCTGENWMLVGDAAGHVNPASVEGISYALWSAELAAKSILHHNHREFDSLWRKEYGRDLIDSMKFKDIMYNPYFLDFSVKLAKKSKTYSKLMFDILANKQDSQTLFKRIIFDLPATIKEYVFSKL
ncbi:MAG: NAD(P)/FAD-dependent oxidoreductase [Candidatus Thermoplasmatota archaeon]|nr:NAD(P)/FAD-dependent oxidoreductase [Candidatus Thermoplasmatota archaeon]